ncbi:uncharacterized protein LOC120267334 [Dioscorea cayenensis subsp. rotundata]|uniref:Uncharacterized protein LOC120267334 n=1 Tax=Dioscorea cayennensis subsp. rotundata TaxID=55577 RepID=A0AB40BXJ1_DIOCR|nr:uncharacterized protein LOC120267334 [Dioscorea cayenensis subsp. rotundata]
MARGSKSLKIMELLEAHTSSHHESTGQENDASTQEKQSRHRGKTVMANVWTSMEKFIIKVDKYGVPCTKDAATLSSFLGVLAKNGAYAPINIPNWRHEDFTPYKAKCLKLLMTKFDFPHTQETVTWILQNLNKRWRDWKGDLKAEFYIPKEKERVLVEPPSTVLEEQWPGLVRQWYNPRNEENKMGKELDRLKMCDATNKKKDSSYVNEEFRKNFINSSIAFALEKKDMIDGIWRLKILHLLTDITGQNLNIMWLKRFLENSCLKIKRVEDEDT